MPSPPDEDLDALVRRRDAEARAAAVTAAERILAIADPAERMRAYTQLSGTLAAEGETLPPDLERRLMQSLRADPADEEKAEVMEDWARERRRLARLHTLRPVAAAGCAVAALLPFAIALWRGSMGLAAFLTLGPGLAGLALALFAAGLLGRLVGKADGFEGLAGLVVGAFAAGVAGLVVARGMVF